VTYPTPPPGWYPAAPGWLRYWDGSAWTEHHAPVAPPVMYAPVAPYVPPGTNHVVHLLLTVFTLGLWAPVWLLIAVQNDRPRRDAIRAAQGIPTR
jgi:hypothetical protein